MLQRYYFTGHVEDITYSEFRKLVQEKRINNLVISTDLIRGKLEKGALEIIAAMRKNPSIKEQFEKMEEEGHPFSTVRMEDPNLVKVLEENGIEYKAQLENTWVSKLLSWVLPFLIFFGIWGFLMRRMSMGAGGGPMTIGKSKARIYVEDETKDHLRRCGRN